MIEFKENFRTRLVKSNRPNLYTSLSVFPVFFLLQLYQMYRLVMPQYRSFGLG